MASGGGSSAGNESPPYLRSSHARMLRAGASDYTALTVGILETMNTAIVTNPSPYNGEVSYAPDTDLTAMLVELTDFDTEIDAMVETTDFNTRSGNAVTKGDAAFPVSDFLSTLSTAMSSAVTAATTAIAEAAITSAVAAFRSDAETGLATRLAQLSSQMADINAVHSSAFAIGEATIEAEVEKQINGFEAEIKLKTFDAVITPAVKGQIDLIVRKNIARDQYVVMAIGEMNKLALAKIEAFKANAALNMDYYKTKIVAKKEEQRENLEMDVNDAMWDFKIFQEGTNMIAGFSGASIISKNEMNPIASAIGGAASGAAMGAQIGSVVPGVGTTIGSIVGGTLGLIGGLS